MNKIEMLIKNKCPNGIRYDKIKNVLKELPKGTLTRNEINQEKKGYPVLNSGTDFYGHYDNYNNCVESIVMASRGANAGYINYINEKYWAGGLCYPYTSKDVNKLLTKFVYYYLKSQEKLIMELYVSKGSIPAINKQDVNDIKIPIPPIEIQEKIVNILDKFSQLEAELEAELELRIKQFDFWREKMLNKSKGEKTKLISVLEDTNNIKWNEITTQTFKYVDLSSVDRETNSITNTKVISKQNHPSRAQQIIKTNDILFGTTRPTLRRYAIVNEEHNLQIASSGYAVLRSNQKLILPSFLYFLISSEKFNQYVERNQQGTSYPAISNRVVKEFEFILPNNNVQKKIINVLKHFETLVHSINEGIPAEIELRKKQYEYFRNKLLTFDELKTN